MVLYSVRYRSKALMDGSNDRFWRSLALHQADKRTAKGRLLLQPYKLLMPLLSSSKGLQRIMACAFRTHMETICRGHCYRLPGGHSPYEPLNTCIRRV